MIYTKADMVWIIWYGL